MMACMNFVTAGSASGEASGAAKADSIMPDILGVDTMIYA